MPQLTEKGPAVLKNATPYMRAVASRLIAGLLVFLLVTFSATALSSLAPGSAAQLILGDYASQDQIDALDLWDIVVPETAA